MWLFLYGVKWRDLGLLLLRRGPLQQFLAFLVKLLPKSGFNVVATCILGDPYLILAIILASLLNLTLRLKLALIARIFRQRRRKKTIITSYIQAAIISSSPQRLRSHVISSADLYAGLPSPWTASVLFITIKHFHKLQGHTCNIGDARWRKSGVSPVTQRSHWNLITYLTYFFIWMRNVSNLKISENPKADYITLT